MSDNQQDKSSRPRIKPDHRRFIQEYLSNGNNGTQAMLSVHPDVQKRSAGVMGSRLLSSVKIQNELQAIAESIGMSNRFLLEKLYYNLTIDTVKSKQTRIDPEGKTIETVVWERDRTPAETAKLVDVANKTTGNYERNRAIGNALSSQFKALAKRYAPKLSRTNDIVDTLGNAIDDDDVVHEDVHESIQDMCAAMCGGVMEIVIQ
jgi:hypothetical protein